MTTTFVPPVESSGVDVDLGLQNDARRAQRRQYASV
jgi:hypothetical protein